MNRVSWIGAVAPFSGVARIALFG